MTLYVLFLFFFTFKWCHNTLYILKTLLRIFPMAALCEVGEMWNQSYRAVEWCVLALSFQFHCLPRSSLWLSGISQAVVLICITCDEVCHFLRFFLKRKCTYIGLRFVIVLPESHHFVIKTSQIWWLFSGASLLTHLESLRRTGVTRSALAYIFYYSKDQSDLLSRGGQMRVTHLQLFEWGTAAQVRNPESDRCGFQRLFLWPRSAVAHKHEQSQEQERQQDGEGLGCGERTVQQTTGK